MKRETTWRDRLYLTVGTCFGLGYSPILPGTCGALVGVAQYLVFVWVLPPMQIVAFCGCPEIAGNEFTVSVAAFEIPGVVQVAFDNCALYL